MNTITPELESLKARLKATWMAGDYGLIAKSTESGAEEFINRLAPQPGTRLLDVACGTGNVAIERRASAQPRQALTSPQIYLKRVESAPKPKG